MIGYYMSQPTLAAQDGECSTGMKEDEIKYQDMQRTIK